MSPKHVIYADAVLFDMDGTLTDSTSAVEAAWTKVAQDINQDPATVIAATHGKRAVDNLADLKPHIQEHQMDEEVANFEETILYHADAYHLHGPGSRLNSGAGTPINTSSNASPRRSRSNSVAADRPFDKPSLDTTDLNLLSQPFVEHGIASQSWRLQAAVIDRSVRILPGVKRLIDSIPSDRYAVATSGAKTYAYGCLERVGITPPPVTITADDKRLKAGKPAPDPFLLAAECLGFDAKNCIVFEDSPSGIKAGLASGATVIAVCTSHNREQIAHCGAHYLVEDMDSVECMMEGDKLKFILST